MIPITQIRSSSQGSWSLCQFQGLLRYSVGLEDASNLKAIKGTCMHKALELLARQKLARQVGKTTFKDEETGRVFQVDNFDRRDAISHATTLYSDESKYLFHWTDTDYRDCEKWVNSALDYQGGMCSPEKRTIISTEKYFELEIKKPWAAYRYELPDGKVLAGQLKIRGTIDLIMAIDDFPDMAEVQDYKSGRRLDWSSGEVKDNAKLRKDFQIRLYHYALSELYPKVKQWVMGVLYVNDGGLYSVEFSRDDLPETERTIRAHFEDVQRCTNPNLIFYNPGLKWKCRFCHYFKNKSADGKQNICEYMDRELATLGMDNFLAKHADFSKLSDYVGGGRTNREEATPPKSQARKI